MEAVHYSVPLTDFWFPGTKSLCGWFGTIWKTSGVHFWNALALFIASHVCYGCTHTYLWQNYSQQAKTGSPSSPGGCGWWVLLAADMVLTYNHTIVSTYYDTWKQKTIPGNSSLAPCWNLTTFLKPKTQPQSEISRFVYLRATLYGSLISL